MSKSNTRRKPVAPARRIISIPRQRGSSAIPRNFTIYLSFALLPLSWALATQVRCSMACFVPSCVSWFFCSFGHKVIQILESSVPTSFSLYDLDLGVSCLLPSGAALLRHLACSMQLAWLRPSVRRSEREVASSTVAWVRCLIATDTTTTAIETIDIILCFVAF
jgi:hypothetical protein